MALPPGILANLLHVLDLVEEFGPSLGRPHIAPLGKGLFATRAIGREGISRTLFCTLEAGTRDPAHLHQENAENPETTPRNRPQTHAGGHER